MTTFIAGVRVVDLVLLGAEEADGVVEEEVALDVIWEVATGDELESGGGADALFFLDDAGGLGGELAIVDVDITRGLSLIHI